MTLLHVGYIGVLAALGKSEDLKLWCSAHSNHPWKVAYGYTEKSGS